MSRKAARECAFKLIYEIPFHPNDTVESRIELFGETAEYGKLTENDVAYFNQTVINCFNNIEAIDEKISRSLVDWSLPRISKVNLSILRLSLSEMKFGGDIPYQISINEAVELAKKYGDDDAPSFVNGVLADVIK